jgi:hypothetical protein
LENQKEKIKNYIIVLYILLGVLWAFIFMMVPYILKNPSIIIPYIKDQAAINSLLLPTSMNGYEPIVGLIFLTGIATSVFLIIKVKIYRALVTVGMTVGFTLLLFSFFILPGIESLSQGPAINFYKTLENKDVYVETIGFKSYAPFFYTKVKPKSLTQSDNTDWLIRGNIDKDVYFVTKSNNFELEKYQEIQKIRSEGGFSFYIRKKQYD